MRRLILLAVPSVSLIAFSLACSSLTAPPNPEPMTISSDPGQVTAPAQKAPPAMSGALTAVGSAMAARFAEAGAPAPGQGQGQGAPGAAAQPDAKLQVQDLTPGKGKEAKAGDRISVHYVGKLVDGKEFDSSRGRNRPFEFQLGQGSVIKGWDQGVQGMKVGGKRKLTIPPSLGYGERGMPPSIPPSSTLVFEVELLEVK